jgi:hypothetical protein
MAILRAAEHVMRNYIVIASTVFVFAGLILFGKLQDRTRAKAGGSLFSPLFLLRCLTTIELYPSILVLFLLAAFVAVISALDRRGLF